MKRSAFKQKRRGNKSGSRAPFIQRKSGNSPFFNPQHGEGGLISRIAGHHATSENETRNEQLPIQLQANLEQAFGHDFSDVQIHQNSKEAVAMNAHAFTKGNDIHFAPGTFNPYSNQGQQLIGHEFTHVAQQRNGVVSATRTLGKGLEVNDNRGLEYEADSFGQKAVKGETINKYQSPVFSGQPGSAVLKNSSKVVQRSVKTFGGEWSTDYYTLKKDEANGVKYAASDGVRGLDVKLRFSPTANADAELIGITQTAQSTSEGKHPFIDGDPNREKRAISKGTERGTMVDRADGYNNPIYAVDTQPSKSLADISTSAGWGQHGWRATTKKPNKQDATLIDTPRLSGATKNSQQLFETTALALKGNQEGTYYGSVKWGWKTDSAGKHSLIPFKKVKDGVPSGKFMRAAKVWNAATDSNGAKTINLPVEWTGTIQNTSLAALRSGKSTSSTVLADLPKGTVLTVLSDASGWHKVQLDKNQAGIVLNKSGEAAVLTGNLIRGYVSKELISKAAEYR